MKSAHLEECDSCNWKGFFARNAAVVTQNNLPNSAQKYLFLNAVDLKNVPVPVLKTENACPDFGTRVFRVRDLRNREVSADSTATAAAWSSLDSLIGLDCCGTCFSVVFKELCQQKHLMYTGEQEAGLEGK